MVDTSREIEGRAYLGLAREDIGSKNKAQEVVLIVVWPSNAVWYRHG
jgi:hypothetical protein